MKTRFDAVVVGAGPAGSSTAILLARAGWSVALVERQRFPRRKVCGECIAASNLPLLDALGIGTAFDRLAGAELRRVALMHGRGTVIADLPAANSLQHGYGRALGREHLDTLLATEAGAAGATLMQPWSLQTIEGGPGRFRVRIDPVEDDGAAVWLDAALVVAAHGSWQPLPSERAMRRATRKPSDLFAFKANFRDAAIAADLLPVLAFAGGYGGMVVADDGLATLACCIREDRLGRSRDAEPGQSAGDVVEAILRRECTGVADALAGARREGPWLATGPIRPGLRLAAGDAVFRVGNAAGEAHPIVGEGISMALQSAFVLASLLGTPRHALIDAATAGPAQRALRSRYERLWRRHFVGRLRLAAAFANAAMRPKLIGALWPMLERWPALLSFGARVCGKTRCAPEALRLAETLRLAGAGPDHAESAAA
ncbi:MAG: FAD-dependent oxidoreductase [Pseudomonadota bacterium]|nr:FAD-dependent oxidoreductase [Pseudomonadota bacterium]